MRGTRGSQGVVTKYTWTPLVRRVGPRSDEDRLALDLEDLARSFNAIPPGSDIPAVDAVVALHERLNKAVRTWRQLDPSSESEELKQRLKEIQAALMQMILEPDE